MSEKGVKIEALASRLGGGYSSDSPQPSDGDSDKEFESVDPRYREITPEELEAAARVDLQCDDHGPPTHVDQSDSGVPVSNEDQFTSSSSSSPSRYDSHLAGDKYTSWNHSYNTYDADADGESEMSFIEIVSDKLKMESNTPDCDEMLSSQHQSRIKRDPEEYSEIAECNEPSKDTMDRGSQDDIKPFPVNLSRSSDDGVQVFVIQPDHPNLKVPAEKSVGEDRFFCPVCSVPFVNARTLKAHIKKHNKNTEDVPSDTETKLLDSPPLKRTPLPLKVFTCSHCQLKFINKSNLIKHERKHTGERPFGCSFCDMRFSDRSNLKKHVMIHTGQKPHCCSYCDARFVQKAHMQTHLLKHTGEKPFICDYCGVLFADKSNLTSHKRLHTGEKPFPCSHCGVGFRTKSNLAKHEKIHTSSGEKTISCSFCNAKFRLRAHLQRHELLHSAATPHACPHCDLKFGTKGNLKTHQRVHTIERSPMASEQSASTD